MERSLHLNDRARVCIGIAIVGQDAGDRNIEYGVLIHTVRIVCGDRRTIPLLTGREGPHK